jgi:TRAP-type C4-dicarboxylate transport system permease small subunit
LGFRGVKTLVRTYDLVLIALAIIAGAMLAMVFVSIVYDVTLRTLGLHPPFWTLTASEYALLYITTLGAPWLLRRKGHVVITTFSSALPAPFDVAAEKLALFLSAASCLLVAIVSLHLVITITGMDVRSFSVPRWVVLITMPPGFFLLAVEFARLLVTGGSLREGEAPKEEGL